MNLKRIIAGKKAQAKGASFEEFIESQLTKQGWLVIRIPDGCKQLPGNRLIRVKSPFDFVALKGDAAVFFDCKRTKDPRIKKNLFPQHQIDWLRKINQTGHFAGFVVHIESTDDIVWFAPDLSTHSLLGQFPHINFDLKTIVSAVKTKTETHQIDPRLGS